MGVPHLDWTAGPPVIGEQGTFRASDVVGEALLTLDAEEAAKEPGTDWIVIVRPGESANRRIYTDSAISEAVANGFWDGSRMFADHGDMKMPTHRSINDLMSRITETRLGRAGEVDAKGKSLAGAALGKAKYLRPGVQEFVRGAGDALGTSIVHRFQGQRFKGTDGQTHERVDHFLQNYSVDWVAYPAAGGGLLGLTGSENEGEDDVDWTELTADMVKSHAPHVVEAIKADAKEELEAGMQGNGQAGTDSGAAGSGTPITQISEERIVEIAAAAAAKAVSEAFDARDSKQRERDAAREQIVAHVNASDLTEKARARVIAGFAGAESFDEAKVDAAIEDMKALVKELGGRGGPKVAGLGGSESVETRDDGPSYDQSYPALAAFEQVSGVKTVAVSEGK